MELLPEDRRQIDEYLRDIRNTEEAQRMKTFLQHGTVTTYAHVMHVVCMSCFLDRKLRLHADRRSLVRGAFLHDFYLYDWHDRTAHKRLHGFRHPVDALRNAKSRFALNAKEENVIVSHMWPLTMTRLPRCREAVIVCVSDKLCALYATFGSQNDWFVEEDSFVPKEK